MGTSPRPSEISQSSLVLLCDKDNITLSSAESEYLGNCRFRESFELEGETAWRPADLCHTWTDLSPAWGSCLFCLFWNKPCNILGWLLYLTKYSSSFQRFMMSQPSHHLILLFFWLISACPLFLNHDMLQGVSFPEVTDPIPSRKVPVYFWCHPSHFLSWAQRLTSLFARCTLNICCFSSFHTKMPPLPFLKSRAWMWHWSQCGCEVVPAAHVNKVFWKRGPVWRLVVFTSHFRRETAAPLLTN